jgi:N-acetylglucosaminyl-diphospho-decaprenol L-rhamnosyltransferase
MNFDVSITFACYNASQYTKLCIESLVKTGTPLDRVVVVDNGSKDDTRDYLSTLQLGGRIFNRSNLGCGVAWNQGALQQQAEWTIIMNNDLIFHTGWIENMISAAIKNNLLVVSPALIEGKLDYDYDGLANKGVQQMQNVLRQPAVHAVCLCIHRSVFQEVGYFRATPSLLGFEDAIFFNDLKNHNIPRGITGAAWLHHFGSVTQSLMKQEKGLKSSDLLVKHNDRDLLRQSWLERKLVRLQRKRQERQWRDQELNQHGMTLHGERIDGGFVWR